MDDLSVMNVLFVDNINEKQHKYIHDGPGMKIQKSKLEMKCPIKKSMV